MVRLHRIGAIERCDHEQGEFISHIFARQKSCGKIRIILNLKQLNQYLSYEHFKMEHLDYLQHLVNKDDWLGSIDLSDAYFSVKINPDHCKYLRFLWKGELFQYKVMVFGLSSAPRVFTRICKPILATLRGVHGIRCSLYIDDMIVINSSRLLLKSNLSTICNIFTSLGFYINKAKSVLEPTKDIKHLGIMISSSTLTLSLPEDKIIAIQRKCRQALIKKDKIEIRTVASLVGTFIASMVGTKFGKLHYRKLEREKILALANSGGNFESCMRINMGTQDILWWLSGNIHEPYFFGHVKPSLTLYSDASNKGWGGHCHNNTTGGRWSSEEQKHHINWLELKAADLTLKTLTKDRTDSCLELFLDNTCAVTYINNMGGRISTLNTIVSDMWNWCKEKNLWVLAKHIPGAQNCIADFKSRVFSDRTEWSLCSTAFNNIVARWGTPEIDLFASRLNNKVDKYFSLEPDPNAVGTDAFVTSWSNFQLCYAFPPFDIIGRVLSKIKHDKAHVLLVVPDWKTQYWFPMIRDIAVEEPLHIAMHKRTISLPFDNTSTHPIWQRLNLMCYRLSGR